MVAWHFDEATGCPFWLDWAKQAGWDPRAEIKTISDINRFPHFQDEWLRDEQNERFVPLLKANRTVRSPKNALPEGLGFKATITWLYYKDLPPMQTFYEEVLGLRQVVDQGWAKVYEGSMNGAA